MKTSSPWLRVLSQAWTWLRWPAAIGVLGWLFHSHREDFAQLQSRQIDWGFLLLGFVLCFGSIASTYIRWWMLVVAQGFSFRLRDALRIGFLGYLFNYVAPGAVGGDLVKAVMLAKEQSSRRLIAAATVAVDRVIGLIALLVTGSLTGIFATPLSRTAEMRTILSTYHLVGLGGLAGAALLMLPAVTRNPLVQKIPQWPVVGKIGGAMIQALVLYQSRWRVMAAALVLSVVGHVAMLSSFYCCARGVHPGREIPTYAEHLQFIPAAELAGVIVPLPGGVGALEFAIAHFYQLAGDSSGDGTLTGVTYRAISLLIAVVGALCYMTIRQDVSAALQESEGGGDPSRGDVEPAVEPATASSDEADPSRTI